MSLLQVLSPIRLRRFDRVPAVLCSLIMTVALFANTSRSQTESATQDVLSREVIGYSQSGSDIAQPLFRVAETFRIPIGIELDGSQPTQTISVNLPHGTVRDLFNAIVGPSPGLQ